jgi:hypothetical protein
MCGSRSDRDARDASAAARRGEMRAVLLLLLLLAVVVFASFYGSALRPYWEERLPRVMSCASHGEFREAASAMVGEEAAGTPPPPSMTVTTSSSEPDTSREAGGANAPRDE